MMMATTQMVQRFETVRFDVLESIENGLNPNSWKALSKGRIVLMKAILRTELYFGADEMTLGSYCTAFKREAPNICDPPENH